METPSKHLLLFYNSDVDNSLESSLNVIALDVFDPKKEEAVPFETYFAGKMPFKVSDLIFPRGLFDSQNRVWLCTKYGDIYQYDGEFRLFCHLNMPAEFISADYSGNIWIGQKDKLILFNQDGKVIQSYLLPGNVCSLFQDGEQGIWFSIDDGKESHLWHLLSNGVMIPFLLRQNGVPVAIPSSKNFFAYHNRRGYWFVDINGALNVFNAKGDWLFNYSTLLDQKRMKQFTYAIEDLNSLWISTPMGVLKVGIKDQVFKLIQKKERSLSDCRGITEDIAGNIYFLNEQLYKWSKQTQHSIQVSNRPSSNVLIYLDSILWAGNYSGTVLGASINLKTKQEREYPSLDQRLYLVALSWSKTNEPSKILIGQNQGLAYLDINNQKILPFAHYNGFTLLQTSEVYDIHENHSGYWLATNNGVFLLSAQAGIIRHFDVASGDLPFNFVRHIYEDHDGIFWMATKGGGIIRWEPSMDAHKHSAFKQFTVTDGLSNNYTYAVYEDQHGKLWVPSDKGLMCVNKKTFEVKTFLMEDGLPHNEFNQGAHYQAKNGNLYFGGLGGLIELDPNTLANEGGNTTPMQFIGYYLLQAEEDHVSDKTALLQGTNLITIRPGDKFFEVHFNLMDYDAPELHQYAYQIEGFNSNWIITKENFIRITNLPYGEYTLKVKGQHFTEGWSDQVISLKIRVVKPFYLQWWFLAVLLCGALLAVLGFVKWRISKLEYARTQLEAQVNARTRTIEESNKIIKAQAESLKEVDNQKSLFLENITHELRSPLTLIITPLEQMKQENMPAIFHKRINGMLNNSFQLLDLINQMLDLSKLEAGGMGQELSRGDLIDYTRSLLDRFHPLMEKKRFRIGFVTNLEHWYTCFDQDKWNKIIYNLLSNAIKFTPENGVIQVCVSRRYAEEKEYIYLSVKDTGIGVGPESLPHLFNRFFQADNSSTRKYGGMGIGLSLVRELVEFLKGDIWVTSTIGKGTSFELTLPVLAPGAGTEKPFAYSALDNLPFPMLDLRTESNGETKIKINKEKLELLIIEDNDEMREYIYYCFDQSKYNITEARCGKEGLEKALAIIPDLIISDVMMPEMDGFAVTKAIRSHFSTSHISIVLLTAKSSLESRLEGIQRGADAFLTKPFSQQELVLRVEQLIEMRSILQLRFQPKVAAMASTGIHEPEEEFILELKGYILEHLNNHDLNGDALGRKFGLSRVHLYRKLKALTGMSISELVKSIRLEQAYDLVIEGKLNISEIAFQTGFSSPSLFTRTFKQTFGRSPSEIYGTNAPIRKLKPLAVIS
jgi:signal transduction histidine kinase/AraC-like DNA-binding protein/ligand-binding sensor domain-containing protein